MPAAAQQQQQQQGCASWGQVLAVLCHNPTAAALATSVVGFSVSYRMYEYSFKAQVGSSGGREGLVGWLHCN
jgi:hypothetical protein